MAETPKILILRGLPASGKSTYARELVSKGWKRVNKDDLSQMLDAGAWSGENRQLVLAVQEDIIRKALKQGCNVVVDNTHIKDKAVNDIHRLARLNGGVTVEEKRFDVPVDECLRRNALRTGKDRVPDSVINSMAKQATEPGGLWSKPLPVEVTYPPRWAPGGSGADPVQLKQNFDLPRAVICDLDGTLCLMNGRSPYDASTCDQDLPNVPVYEAVMAAWMRGAKILFVSGREDKFRPQTMTFLEKHLPRLAPFVLHMRPSGDTRQDSIIKREIFEREIDGKYYVLYVMDDRKRVCEEWRQIGLTVFQVAEGDF